MNYPKCPSCGAALMVGQIVPDLIWWCPECKKTMLPKDIKEPV